MFQELLSIFRSGNPLATMGENFTRMLTMALENTLAAGEIFFGKKSAAEERTRIYEQDVQINKLERTIRKQVLTHLAIKGNHMDVPYCLLMMSLVKDVERLGDYAKNLMEIVDLDPEPLPSDDIVGELTEIRRAVEASFKTATEIFANSDRERALESIQSGRNLAQRCDHLLSRIARGPYGAAAATALVLAARYYKRLGGHVINILSSVVMPLHKIDYYDETAATVVDD